MNLIADLKALKPTKRLLVFDLVKEAGYNISDWLASATNSAKAKANPKYCYEWSFVEADKVVIFNLWHDIMKPLDGAIVYQENFRANAAYHTATGGKSQWIARGLKLDHAMAQAAQGRLPIRVIVLDGDRRNTEDPNSRSSRVTARELDPSEWHVRHYNADTGDFVLARGPVEQRYVDQFDVVTADAVERRIQIADAFVRSSQVRRAVLRRARGACELCGTPGFMTADGRAYLETHHVVRLADGGADSERNVLALCPEHHRRAHFAADRDSLREAFLTVLKTSYSAAT